MELNNPPQILKSEFDLIFGKVPNTRNPNLITKEQLIALAKIADINLEINSC